MMRFRCEIMRPHVSGRFVYIPRFGQTDGLSWVFTIMSVRRNIFKTQHLQRQGRKSPEHCCVPLCAASSKSNGYLSFHGFPVHTELRTRWLVNIRRDPFTILSHTKKVCSRHFTPDQLIEPRRTAGRRRLVTGAVPRLFHWNGYSIQTPRPGVWENTQSPVSSTQHRIKDHDYCAAPEPASLGVSCVENEALSREVEELRNRLQSYCSASLKIFDPSAGNKHKHPHGTCYKASSAASHHQ